MLGIDRRAARYAWTVTLVLLALYLVYIVRRTLFVFILAVLFAYLLSPLVNLLDRFMLNRPRTAALALAYVLVVGGVVTAGILIGSRVADQAGSLAHNLPAIVSKWENAQPGASPGILDKYKVQIVDHVRSEISARSGDLISALAQVGVKFLTVASNLIYVVIIPVLAFFFLKDGHAIRLHILGILEEGPRRTLLDDVLADLDKLLARYMRALVVLSLAAFTAYSIFFPIVGVPYGFLLAAFGAALELIPMLGPLAAGVTIFLVAVFSGAHPLVVLIFLIAYRMLQDYVLSPHLMGKGVELHPILILFGVFAGAEVAGIAGTFLSVPVLALARIVYLRLRKMRVIARPDSAGAL